jgi:hypothetical protein
VFRGFFVTLHPISNYYPEDTEIKHKKQETQQTYENRKTILEAWPAFDAGSRSAVGWWKLFEFVLTVRLG